MLRFLIVYKSSGAWPFGCLLWTFIPLAGHLGIKPISETEWRCLRSFQRLLLFSLLNLKALFFNLQSLCVLHRCLRAPRRVQIRSLWNLRRSIHVILSLLLQKLNFEERTVLLRNFLKLVTLPCKLLSVNLFLKQSAFEKIWVLLWHARRLLCYFSGSWNTDLNLVEHLIWVNFRILSDMVLNIDQEELIYFVLQVHQ